MRSEGAGLASAQAPHASDDATCNLRPAPPVHRSWFYWAGGIWLGLAMGTVYGLRTYWGTLLTDLLGASPHTTIAITCNL